MLVIRCLEETVYNCQIFLILIRPCAKLVNENWILIVAVKEQQSVHLCHCQLEGGWWAGPSISVSEGEVGVRGQREAYEPNVALRDNAVTQQRAMQLSDCLNCTLRLPAIERSHSPHWRRLWTVTPNQLFIKSHSFSCDGWEYYQLSPGMLQIQQCVYVLAKLLYNFLLVKEVLICVRHCSEFADIETMAVIGEESWWCTLFGDDL